ncbi:uncharacterized protein LOC110733943 [Chenopodium quinoa]|uniref:uncharacterized protein LOC110733943 n=1 Tax=Chenopodium quinoa TaxID=63459 RepID=UPI000B780BFF|nr:uncharacterized protein LOC110733943 [Chenopodium quinoa]
MLDLSILKYGARLSKDAADSLCAHVSTEEIDNIVKAFDDSKAPGLDGYNSVFFKNSWHIIKQDVYTTILDFFANGLQTVITEVVCDCQDGFVPGRHIADNILLGTELIKGYGRAHNSPRCMIKVDLNKAYDSIEWGFLKIVLQELGFPMKFMGWITECLATISYSILINGFL